MIEPNQIGKVLVISLSNIGDAILTTPVISFLRQKFPSCYLAVLTGSRTKPLFSGSQTINEVVIFNKSASWWEQLQLIAQLRKQKFDLVVDLRNTAIPILLQPKYRTSIFMNHSSVLMREKHLDRLRPLFRLETVENKFVFFSDAEQSEALGKLVNNLPGFPQSDFIVLAPGAGSTVKRWTVSGFVAVAQYLLEKGNQIVLLGDEREVELGQALQEKLSKPVANLIGMLSLRESASLINRASLVIANDSAIMHLAHELERRTVAIFGPTNEKRYGRIGPLFRTVRLALDCTPCEQAQCRLERRICLDDLSVDQVTQACEELLQYAPH